jgi:class 3 adenylate cyclase
MGRTNALSRPYTPQVVRCPSCGEENPVRFRHCGFCGAALAQASAVRETRKTVTILFTDVTGSTALGERLDPESLRDVMGRYFASMREVIERHGGTVDGERIEAAALTEVAADVETLAGDHDAAERVLAAGCDWFLANGGPHEILEALHGLAQVAAGHPVDVQRLADMAAGTTRASRALLEIAMAAAHLCAGSLVEAERDARTAVAFFATTDFITFHADSAVVLGDVLRKAGRREDADAAFEQALQLYRQKGSQVSVASVAARLAG